MNAEDLVFVRSMHVDVYGKLLHCNDLVVVVQVLVSEPQPGGFIPQVFPLSTRAIIVALREAPNVVEFGRAVSIVKILPPQEVA